MLPSTYVLFIRSKSLILSIILFLFFLVPLSAIGQKKDHKIIICHDGKTIEIDKESLNAHLQHGDVVGPCYTGSLDGEILPYYNPPNGKVEEEIGAELTSLIEKFNTYGSIPSDDIYTISGDRVLVEIIAEDVGSLQSIRDALLEYDVIIYDDYLNEED